MPGVPRGALLTPATWTLRTKLLVSVLSLFTLVTALVGAITIGAASRYLSAQLGDDLRAAASRTDLSLPVGQSPITPELDLDGDDGHRPGRGVPGGSTELLVLAVASDGTVLRNRAGASVNYVVNRKGESDSLDPAQIRTVLEAAPLRDARRVEVGGDVGSYLLLAQPLGGGATRIIGLPTRGVDGVLRTLFQLILAGLLLGLLGMWLGGRYLLRRSLAPLGRVAAVAERVSGLRLDQGRVALPERVAIPAAETRTEVGQVGTALNTMLDNVESALVAREASESKVRQFVADASHELRTPLASIRGYAELSRREPDPVPDSVRHALGRVESEAVRMQGLVEDLLLLARLDAGRPLARAEVDLSRIAMDSVGDAHAAAPDHRWELDLPEDPITVTGDEGRLRQVMVNLLANARTHTPAGTLVVTRLRVEGDDAVITVTDDGPGIPEALQHSVFERFTRGDESRNRASGSSGLGLSIVAAVVQAHRGTVTVESAPGRTQFRVALPTPTPS